MRAEFVDLGELAVKGDGSIRQNRRAGAVIDPLADGEAVFAGMARSSCKSLGDGRWSSARTLTAKTPRCSTTAAMEVERLTQAISDGGSVESEQTAVAVIPQRRPSASSEVMMVTPPARRRIPARKRSLPIVMFPFLAEWIFHSFYV